MNLVLNISPLNPLGVPLVGTLGIYKGCPYRLLTPDSSCSKEYLKCNLFTIYFAKTATIMLVN
jgi:hypothetical protein